jgi:formylglycine-generating enzyme required for sulfatase activity
MTQGQWLRATAENPSGWFAGTSWDGFGVVTRASPVERVDWWECDRVLRRYGLLLPTEAQFECALRGGTTTPWWWAADETRTVANVAGPRDGYEFHAPVDAFVPNPFGFFCISGNLWEWCRDWFAERYAQTAPLPGDGLLDSPLPRRKAQRGGGFRHRVDTLRSAQRKPEYPSATSDTYGVRPARRLER